MSPGFWRRMLVGGCAAAAVTGAAAFMMAQPESQLLGATLVAGRDPDELALTYDDGPNDRSTLPLLEVLERHHARATFFMIGRFVRQAPEMARRVRAAGHLVGNHTMSHPFLANKSRRVIRDEIRACNQALEDALGERVRYFRAPYGARRPAVLDIVRELGLVPVQWNVQGNDWEPIGVDGILRHIGRGLARAQRRQRGANVLLHDGFDQFMGSDRSDTVAATEVLLSRAREQGKRIVTVDAWG